MQIRTTRQSFSPISVQTFKSLKCYREWKETEFPSSHSLPAGMCIGSNTLESNLAICIKLKIGTAIPSKIYTMKNFTQVCKVEHK